jgi:acyl carrier protein
MMEIRRILGDELGRPVTDLRPDQELQRDLRMDSMELITLAVGLEDRFRVILEESDAAKVMTVGDLATLVSRRAAERAGQR